MQSVSSTARGIRVDNVEFIENVTHNKDLNAYESIFTWNNKDKLTNVDSSPISISVLLW